MLGPNVGVAPYELVDCLLGFFMIDIQKDDFGRGYKKKEKEKEKEKAPEPEKEIETEEVIELE